MIFHFKRLDLNRNKNVKVLPVTLLMTFLLFIIQFNTHASTNRITLLTPPSPGEFYYEVAQEIFKITGTNVKTQIESYPSIYKKMNSTTPDSKEIYATIAVLNENNIKKYHNILNIISIETSFYTLKDSKKNSKTVDEVKNLKGICVWLDSVLNKYLINQGFHNLIPVPTLNQCVNMLFTGKVDALYSSEAPLIKSAKALDLDITKLKKGYTPMRVTFFLALTKNASKEYVKKLTNSGKQFKSSGRYDEILDKYKKDLFLPQ
ncbi:MAG: ABC transporter substrate-binding protein [Silvanigrellaceae bacterium]|nr:ABC transporter substrate-binding protein [Silvanigrellaceae bacterium]